MEMRKCAAALLGVLLAVSATGHGFAADKPLVVKGMVVDQRTMAPLRAVSVGLGAKVTWSQKDKTITIVRGDNTVVLGLGSHRATLNGTEIPIDVPALVERNTTYVPIRYVAQALGGTLRWDDATGATDVTVNGQTVRIVTAAGK